MGFAVDIGYLFKSGAALVFIIFLANVLLKKLHTFSGNKKGAIAIVERIPVGKSSSLAIAEIAGSYYLMSLTETGSEILKEFSAEEARELLAESTSVTSKKPKQKPTTARLQLSDFRKNYADMFEK
ncbi:flagellar biosynthetic protein FliO [Atopococcus tabaci]|uniref:flagellar biosynthetic protein FliO n=1 Tax=Atopococcus tabaci TaxID=269774 RepID=UPI0004042A67|nr:flagellar biosynthetic protein FliO [Atopococcus tabaci]